MVPTELIATAKLGLALGNGSEGVDRMHRILQPLQALLRFLSQTKPKVIRTVKGSAARHQGSLGDDSRYRMHEMQRLALCAAVQLFIAGYDALQRAQALHFLRRRNSVPMLSSGRARKVHGPKYQPVWLLDEVTAPAAVPIDDIVPGRRRSLRLKLYSYFGLRGVMQQMIESRVLCASGASLQ